MMNKKILCAQKQVKTKKADGKTMYKAVARMKDDDHEWDVLIYSMYDCTNMPHYSENRGRGRFRQRACFIASMNGMILKRRLDILLMGLRCITEN